MEVLSIDTADRQVHLDVGGSYVWTVRGCKPLLARLVGERVRYDSAGGSDTDLLVREPGADECASIVPGDELLSVEPDPSELVQVSVYLVSRHYGGPEEGGWYYDWRTFEGTSVRCQRRDVERVSAELETEFADEQCPRGRHSAAGGDDVEIRVERRAGESQSTSRPRYE